MKIKRIVGSAAVFALACVAGGAYILSRPYRSFAGEAFVEIRRGMGARQIAETLAGAGVIQTPWHLLAVKALDTNVKWQAGEYRFDKPATVWEVSDRIRRGDVYLVEVRIPEGYNLYEIAEALERSKLMTQADFLRAARDPSLIRDLAPQAPSLEGFLFPSTYHVPRRTTAEAFCRLLTDQFRREWKTLGGDQNVLSTVTLASLVEKETGVPAERGLVAGVYRNRITQGMKLEADPTTIYAARLEGAWRGTIYRSDLQRVHPYNTYTVPGLPPGPIANPGKASLAAALAPAQTDNLFFVAKPDGSGGHTFSKTLAEHSKAVSVWRRSRTD